MVMPLNYPIENRSNPNDYSGDIFILPEQETLRLQVELAFTIETLLQLIPERTKGKTLVILKGLDRLVENRVIDKDIFSVLFVLSTPDVKKLASKLASVLAQLPRNEAVQVIKEMKAQYRKILSADFTKTTSTIAPEDLPTIEKTQPTHTVSTDSFIDFSTLSESAAKAYKFEIDLKLAKRYAGLSILDLYKDDLKLLGLKPGEIDAAVDRKLVAAMKSFSSSVDELIELSLNRQLTIHHLIRRPNLGFGKLSLIINFLQNFGLIKVTQDFVET